MTTRSALVRLDLKDLLGRPHPRKRTRGASLGRSLLVGRGLIVAPLQGLHRTSMREDRNPRSDVANDSVLRRREQEWLGRHREQYRGQWVALEAERLVGQGRRAQEALDTARMAGFLHPLLVYISEEPDLPFGGW